MSKKGLRESRYISIRLPERVRLWLTESLLNWAEKQPKASKFPIYQLQVDRQSQRKLSEGTFERTRPPAGTGLEILGIRIFEVFHYEDFKKALTGLLGLFPDIDNQRLDETFSAYFQKLSESITTSGWSPIGYLYRDGPLFFGGGNSTRNVPDLHPFIKYVHVGLYKPLPSMLILTFDIVLTDEASKKLNEIQAQRYLGQARLNKIYLDTFLLGISRRMPDDAQTNAILGWLAEIRHNIERIIRPNVRGYFMERAGDSCKLPAIEIYSLEGVKSTKASFLTWINNARHWWRSYHFNFFRGSLFGSANLVYCWRELYRENSLPIANRMIIFPDKFLSERDRSLQGENISAAIWINLRDLLDSIITPIAVVEVLNSSIRDLEKLRRLIFDAIKLRNPFLNNLSRYVKLHQNFQQLDRMLRRIFLEFQENGGFVKHQLKAVDSWKEIYVNEKMINRKKRSFSDDVVSRFDNLSKLLLSHLDFVEKNFSSHIEFLNIDAVYRLQMATYLLTIAATLATLVGLIINWEQLVKVANLLWKFLFL